MNHSTPGQAKDLADQVVDAVQMLLLGNKTEGIIGREGSTMKIIRLPYTEYILQGAIRFNL